MMGPFTPEQARRRLDDLWALTRLAGGLQNMSAADQQFVLNEYSRLARSAAEQQFVLKEYTRHTRSAAVAA